MNDFYWFLARRGLVATACFVPGGCRCASGGLVSHLKYRTIVRYADIVSNFQLNQVAPQHVVAYSGRQLSQAAGKGGMLAHLPIAAKSVQSIEKAACAGGLGNPKPSLSAIFRVLNFLLQIVPIWSIAHSDLGRFHLHIPDVGSARAWLPSATISFRGLESSHHPV
ncbi:MAG: hypothetical protein WBG17_07370 [Burkholderiaceae bacterium]